MSLGELLRTKSSEYELLADWHVLARITGASGSCGSVGWATPALSCAHPPGCGRACARGGYAEPERTWRPRWVRRGEAVSGFDP
jgi:hypothetical protein